MLTACCMPCKLSNQLSSSPCKAAMHEVACALLADATREEEELVGRLQEALAAVPELAGVPYPPLLSVQSALARPQPQSDPERRLPLTW